jgi:hypothetical protein
MKPSFWSQAAHLTEGKGWFHAGHNVDYDISPYHGEIN